MDEMEIEVDISWLNQIIFIIFGKVYLEHRQLKGWNAPLPFYLLNCKIHGPYEDYLHDERYFLCPVCFAIENIKESDS